MELSPFVPQGTAAHIQALTAAHAHYHGDLPFCVLPFHFQAVKSLKQYPLPLRSGQEAKILEGIGDKIANMLDRKLAKHSTTNAGTTHATPMSSVADSAPQRSAR